MSQYYILLYCKACTKYFPVACTQHFPLLLCTTMLAHGTPHYYFVLQSLHKFFLQFTLHTSRFTLHTSNFTLSTTHSKLHVFHFTPVLQSSHKALSILLCPTKLTKSSLPSTTLYNKRCTQHFPLLLLTTKFAHSTSQYYFVLQSSHIFSLQFALRAPHFTPYPHDEHIPHTSDFTLHTPLHTPFHALHPPAPTAHFTLAILHFTLNTSRTLSTAHSPLHTSHPHT